MTLSYLSQTQASVCDVLGAAVCTFRPDTGQYWLPTIVHVGNRSGNPIQAGLHYGGVSVVDSTTLKDFTYLGFDDTSTILSGVVVQPGEAVTCHFQNGTPGDFVFATLTGVSSDVPPTIGIVPTVPGARFAGAFSAFALSRNLIWVLLGFARTVAVQTTITTINVVNVNSVGVRLFSQTGGGQLTINWFADQGLTEFVTEDVVNVVVNSTYDQSINIKGAFAQIVMTPLGGSWTFTGLIYETTGPIIPQLSTFDNVLLSNQQVIAATATFTDTALRVIAAPAVLYCVSDSPKWFANVEAFDAAGTIKRLFTMNQATPVQSQALFLPTCNVRIKVTNQDAANHNFEWALTTKPLYS